MAHNTSPRRVLRRHYVCYYSLLKLPIRISKKKKNDKHPIATEEVFARPNVQYSSVERQKDNHEYRVVLLVGKCLLRVGTV